MASERFGDKLLSVEYQHSDDGRLYRHDSRDDNVDVLAEHDGSVRLRRRNGLPMWGGYDVGGKTQTFFENPRGRMRKRNPPATITARYALVYTDKSKSYGYIHSKYADLAAAEEALKAYRRMPLQVAQIKVEPGASARIVRRFPRPSEATLKKNPRGRKRASVAGRARRRVTTSRKVAKRKASGVPAWIRAKGFSSYAAYMASIRPTSAGGTTVAKARRRRKAGAKRSSRRRSVTAARTVTRRRRVHRNPPGGSIGAGFAPRTLMASAIQGAKDAAAGVGGMATARLVRGRLNMEGNTAKGSLVELAVGLLTAPLVARFAGRDVGRAWVQGAFMGPAMTAIKSAHVPIISPALGDEGELPLFGGVYDPALGGTYDLDAVAAGGAGALPAGGRVGDADLGDDNGSGDNWN